VSTPRLWLACAIVAGCGGSGTSVDAFTGLCTDAQPLPATFTSMKQIFVDTCTTCHTTGIVLDLEPAVAYANLVGKPASSYTNPPTDETCGGTLVVPGNPSSSYLYIKLTSTPCAGVSMPRTDIGTPSSLPACQLSAIHDWIAAGAADN
jgi:hypothetical protein